MLPAVYCAIQSHTSRPAADASDSPRLFHNPAGFTAASAAAGPRVGMKTGLYPPVRPFNRGYLRVSDVHELYFEECGNPRGKPVVFLHGGPAAAPSQDAALLRPAAYRIVLFDQRGCGKSRPHAEPASTTPPGIWSRTWSGCASTWASSAGRSSAAPGARRSRWPTPQTHPDGSPSWCCAASSCCAAGRSTGSTRTRGAAALYPGPVGALPRADPAGRARDDMVRAYHSRLTSDDPQRCASGGKRLVDLGGRDQLPAPEPRVRREVRRGRLRRGVRAHRVPLLRQRGFLRARRSAARRRRQDPQHPGGDRAGPLRRGLPDEERLGPASRLARGGPADRGRRRPLGLRAGHHPRVGARDRPLRAPQARKQPGAAGPAESITPCARNQSRASSASESNQARRVSQPEAVAPGIHVGVQALAPDARQLIREQHLQVAHRGFLRSSPPASRSSPERRSGVMQM